MLTIPVKEAVGTILCHDVTAIIPGKFKGTLFKKGHIIREEDIPELLKIGKEHIYVWELEKGQVHEDDAARRIAQAISGMGLESTEPQEGKIHLKAKYDGVCAINEGLLLELNLIDDIIIATRSNMRMIKKGDTAASLRIRPLTTGENTLVKVEELTKEAVVNIYPLQKFQVGIVTTGGEVYNGRIKDKFGPFLQKKMSEYGCTVLEQIIVPDDSEQITSAIEGLIKKGAGLILTTGGMSVDPDDVTPAGIKALATEIITHGAPVFPGTQVLVAYKNELPIIGLPGGVMFSRTSVLDLLIPYLLAGIKIDKKTIAKLGLGGLCLFCEVCYYPICPFGTGA